MMPCNTIAIPNLTGSQEVVASLLTLVLRLRTMQGKERWVVALVRAPNR
jgi:hypothetical protein